MNPQNQYVTQAEFARITGYSRSYVTNLKTAGRLVLNATGQVDVEASKSRIAETASMNRDDVAQRWGVQRRNDEDDGAGLNDEPAAGHRFQSARASKEFYSAELARIEFERRCGKLIDKADTEDAIGEVFGILRQNLEQMPARLAPELVGKELDAIRAIIKKAVFNYLTEMSREFAKRLQELGEGVDDV